MIWKAPDASVVAPPEVLPLSEMAWTEMLAIAVESEARRTVPEMPPPDCRLKSLPVTGTPAVTTTGVPTVLSQREKSSQGMSGQADRR